MSKLNVKSRVVLGLVGITVSLVMLAFFLGIIPDREGAVRAGHASLAEVIALHCTALVLTDDIQRLESDLNLMAQRNDDLLSLALRRSDGMPLIAIADHVDQWRDMQGEYSRETQVRVPIWSGDVKWGQLELRFKALHASGLMGMAGSPVLRLTLFFAVLGFAMNYLYMSKVLRHLDPSQAIPGRVRSALDTLAGGLLIVDRKEQIVLANKSFATLVGKTSKELLGYRAGDLPWVDETDNAVMNSDRPWVKAMQEGKILTNRILRLYGHDRQRLSFSVNCSPVLGSAGKYAGVLVSFDDITELEKKELELRRSKEIAETANRTKSAFLANMSHEIRTPMTAILGFTEILKRGYGKKNEDIPRYLDTIHSSGKNLLNLINDILDLSKVESGRLEVEKVTVEPYRIVHEAIQVLEIKAREKGVALELDVKSALPQKIETDPTRFRQIIFNLVGNAIKFTDQGSVRLVLRYRDAPGTPLLEVDVIDTGIGITDDKVEAIFDPFTQADTSITRQFGGTGLGLSISRKFARALGGDITVKSVPGDGSTFRLALATGDLKDVPMLELGQLTASLGLSRDGSAEQWQFTDTHVLIVDDGAENRELLRLVLEESGISVDEAENGKAGVLKAVEGNYDAILMDVNMPVMDGFSATQKLRQEGLDLPIIALTANAMKGFEEECLSAGYSGYFSKPIDIDRFQHFMAELLGGAATCETPSGEEDIPEEDTHAATGETPGPIISRLPADNPRFQQIIRRFVDKLHGELSKAEAVLAEGDMESLNQFAHWLKGAGGTVGFDAFTEPATDLEVHAKNDQPTAAGEVFEKIKSIANHIVLPPSAQAG